MTDCKTTTDLHPDYVVATLFSALEVGLEGCPIFEEYDLPDDEGTLTADAFHHADGSMTRAVRIGGRTYNITVGLA